MKNTCLTCDLPPANNKRNFIFSIDFPLYLCYTVIVPRNRKGICTMAKLTKTQLTNQKRDEVLAALSEFLVNEGEDVLRVSGNAIAFPTVDAEGNEIFVKLTISIPRGSRLDGEAYDAYGEATQYQEHCEEVAANKARKEKEKQAAAKKRAEQAAERKRKKEAEEAAKAARKAEENGDE